LHCGTHAASTIAAESFASDPSVPRAASIGLETSGAAPSAAVIDPASFDAASTLEVEPSTSEDVDEEPLHAVSARSDAATVISNRMRPL
jgi:hypothetical protein